MKKLRYSVLGYLDEYNQETGETEKKECVSISIMDYSEEALEFVKRESYKGEYEIFDDGEPEPIYAPTQLDVIEAQVTYTAMMTDTLLEV